MAHSDDIRFSAFLYAAKSTEDKHGSIPDQLAKMRERAEREGWEIRCEETDEGFSAYSGNRGPGLERTKAAAIEAAERGEQALLVALHSDRIARGAGDEPGAADHLVEVVSHLRRHGVQLRTVEDDLFADERIGLLMAAVQGQRNTEDSRRKSLSVKAGHARSRARGKVGGSRSLGYELKRRSLDDEERTLVIVPAEAAIVKRVYAEFLAGQSQLGISRDLARDGVPTASGGEWHPSTVRRVLMNPVYTALVRLGGRKGTEFVEAAHEPIIERSKWEEVQALIGAKASTYRRGRESRGSHLFRRGHLRCECGAAMVPRTERGEREVYRCYARLRDPASCSMPPIKRAEVDEAVFAYFAEVGLDIEATRAQMREARDQKLAEVKALLAAAEAEASEAAAAVDRIERDYGRGALDAEDWQHFKAKFTPEREAARAERNRLRDRFAQVEADTDFLDVESEVIADLARLRAAIAGEITDATGVEAVRAVLLRQFVKFTLRREGVTPSPAGGSIGPDATDVYLDDDGDGMRWIEPEANWHAVEGFDENFRPVLARKPLGKAKNNCDPLSTGS